MTTLHGTAPIPESGVREVDGGLLEPAATLLAAYLEPRVPAPELHAHCRRSLEALLDCGTAQCFIASTARAWAGIAVVYWGFSPSKAAPVLILQDLFVLERHRRTGVATMLLRRLEDVARARGATRIQLQTDADNPARRLYAGMGFELLPQKTVYMRFL